MALDPNDLSIIESGWWDNGQRTGDMKDDPVLKNFKVWDIFLDYTPFVAREKHGKTVSFQSGQQPGMRSDLTKAQKNEK